MNDLFSEQNEQKNFVEVTTKLKNLINQAKSSGRSAWEAGKLFQEIKDNRIYKEKYTSFESYIKEQFDITDQTANSYIKICENFKLEEIGDLLSSNLIALADVKNPETRRKVVEVFASRKTKDFRAKDVITTIAFIGDRIDISQEEIEAIINEVLEESKGIDKNTEGTNGTGGSKGTGRVKPSKSEKYGKPFEKEECVFPVYKLIERKPINEMGVVALFCIIFQWIKNKPFYHHKKGTLEFYSMSYIQTAFPDITLNCQVNKKSNKDALLEIKAEFEYKSRNYLEHEHHKSTKECDLIICWEDNVRNNNQKKQSDIIQRMPPILELKEFLKTGEIILRF